MGGECRRTSFQSDGSRGDSTKPTCLLNSIFFFPNRVTHVPITKEFHSFCVAYFMAEKVTLYSFFGILLLDFSQP